MPESRAKLIAPAGSLQYTPPILRLQQCPQCKDMAILCPDIRLCAPCGVERGTPTAYRFIPGRGSSR